MGTVLGFVLAQPRQDGWQADLVRVAQRSAPMGGKAVTLEPDDVDVGGAFDDVLFQDIGGFVDHGVQAALQNFLVGDLPRLSAGGGAVCGDQCFGSR
ncbi:hypothetical protein D3C86_1394440 [compost metagenome]